LRAVSLAQMPGPNSPGRAVLGDLFEEVTVRVEEERQSRKARTLLSISESLKPMEVSDENCELLE
jgi:hypothetical protein